MQFLKGNFLLWNVNILYSRRRARKAVLSFNMFAHHLSLKMKRGDFHRGVIIPDALAHWHFDFFAFWWSSEVDVAVVWRAELYRGSTQPFKGI